MEIRIQLKCGGKVSVLKQIMKQSYIKHVGSINIGEQVLYLHQRIYSAKEVSSMAQELRNPLSRSRFYQQVSDSHICVSPRA